VGAHFRLRKPLYVRWFEDSAFGDENSVRRHLADQSQRGLEAGLEGAQIAVIDSDERRLEPQGALQLVAIVAFNQHVEANGASLAFEGREGRIRDRVPDEEDASRAPGTRFVDVW